MAFNIQGPIADADDVNFSALAQGNAIRYDSVGGRWKNVVPVIAGSDIPNNSVTEPKLAIANTPANGQILGWNGSAMNWQTLPSGSGSSVGALTVASSEASAAVKARADYICTGTNDQTVINQALVQASRIADGYGGAGRIGVQLVGPSFYVCHDGTTSITMYPSTHLFGSGPGTLIQPMWPSSVDRGTIELLDVSVAHIRISNLTIGRTDGTLFGAHGIKLVGQGRGSDHEIKTARDPFNWIDYVTVIRSARKGMWLTGLGSGGSRESQVSHCLFYGTVEEGLRIEGSSDSQVSDCIASGGGASPRFAIGGGNTKVAQCLATRGGADTNAQDADGFSITSSRCEITSCTARDNGRWGFNIATGNGNVFGCTADSNSRLQSTGGGFTISSDCAAEGIVAYDRGATPGSPQNRGVVFTGSPNVIVTGHVSVASGTAHVVGSPRAGSFARVTQSGRPVYSIG